MEPVEWADATYDDEILDYLDPSLRNIVLQALVEGNGDSGTSSLRTPYSTWSTKKRIGWWVILALAFLWCGVVGAVAVLTAVLPPLWPLSFVLFGIAGNPAASLIKKRIVFNPRKSKGNNSQNDTAICNSTEPTDPAEPRAEPGTGAKRD